MSVVRSGGSAARGILGTVAWMLAAAAAAPAQLSFGPPSAVSSAADAALSVHAADVDGDGDVDALSASFTDDTVAWYENAAGDGSSWSEHVITSSAINAYCVHAADMDRDGDLDVLSASAGDDTVAWYENTAGDGSSWSTHVVTSSAGDALFLRAADVDGDGDLDVLAAAFSADQFLWYENTAGDGSSWSTHVITSTADGAYALVAADVDGDGDTDVVTAAGNADQVAWHENATGDGSSWVEHGITNAALGALAVHTADLDRDGDLDVVSASYLDNRVAWYENATGDGASWTEHTLTDSAEFACGVLALDLDGDGDADVLSASGDDDTVAWYENIRGDGTEWSEQILSVSADFARSVAVADVDADGDLDVLSASQQDDRVDWYENVTSHTPKAPYLVEATVASPSSGVVALALADVDRDGDHDLIGALDPADQIAWYENLGGTGTSWSSTVIFTGVDWAQSVSAGDVDGDGDADALSAGVQDDTVRWHANTIGDGSAWTTSVVTSAQDGPQSVHLVDADRDGDLDALVGSRFDETIAWYENTASDGSAWVQRLVSTSAGGTYDIGSADVDGDGDPDVLSANVSAQVLWFENSAGDGSAWTEQEITALGAFAPVVEAADMDGDGDVDVFSVAAGADRILQHENVAGDGSSWSTTIVQIFSGAQPRGLSLADIDEDGDRDIAVAEALLGAVTWLENTAGDGSAWTGHTVDSAASGVSSVVAADLDGDGELDIAAGGQSRLGWYPSRSLIARQSAVSLAAGGTQVPVLNGGDASALEFYWILGSVTGTLPGQPIPPTSLVLPLNFDGYFLLTIFQPNALVSPSLGFLDASGAGAAVMALPPGLDPGLAGVTFHHAYGIIDVFGAGDVQFVSNALAFRLLP